MRNQNPLRVSSLLGAAATLCLVLCAPPARAVPCAVLDKPVAYVSGDDTLLPLMRALAGVFYKGQSPLTLVFQAQGGCAALASMLQDVSDPPCSKGGCLKGKATFFTMDVLDDGLPATNQCDLDAGGARPNLVLSEVGAASCPTLTGKPAGFLELRGPVAPLSFVATRASKQRAIQHEEAYFVLGRGKDAAVGPWVDEGSVVVRGEGSAWQALLGLRLGIRPDRPLRGVVLPTTEELLLRLDTAPEPDASLGFLAAVQADRRRGSLRPLAFQAARQRRAYYPDRRANSFDKKNVRDGHYPLWGQLHLVARDEGGKPQGPAARLADLILGVRAEDARDPLELQVGAGLIPQCAMEVQRDAEERSGQPLKPYAAPEPCGCWFERKVTQAEPACTACRDDQQCGQGRCRRGYCEAR